MNWVSGGKERKNKKKYEKPGLIHIPRIEVYTYTSHIQFSRKSELSLNSGFQNLTPLEVYAPNVYTSKILSRNSPFYKGFNSEVYAREVSQ